MHTIAVGAGPGGCAYQNSMSEDARRALHRISGGAGRRAAVPCVEPSPRHRLMCLPACYNVLRDSNIPGEYWLFDPSE